MFRDNKQPLIPRLWIQFAVFFEPGSIETRINSEITRVVLFTEVQNVHSVAEDQSVTCHHSGLYLLSYVGVVL